MEFEGLNAFLLLKTGCLIDSEAHVLDVADRMERSPHNAAWSKVALTPWSRDDTVRVYGILKRYFLVTPIEQRHDPQDLVRAATFVVISYVFEDTCVSNREAVGKDMSALSVDLAWRCSDVLFYSADEAVLQQLRYDLLILARPDEKMQNFVDAFGDSQTKDAFRLESQAVQEEGFLMVERAAEPTDSGVIQSHPLRPTPYSLCNLSRDTLASNPGRIVVSKRAFSAAEEVPGSGDLAARHIAKRAKREVFAALRKAPDSDFSTCPQCCARMHITNHNAPDLLVHASCTKCDFYSGVRSM